MKEFIAIEFSDKEILLMGLKQIKLLMDTLNNDENFILIYSKENIQFAKLMMASDLLSKIKNGDVIVKSVEKEVNK